MTEEPDVILSVLIITLLGVLFAWLCEKMEWLTRGYLSESCVCTKDESL